MMRAAAATQTSQIQTFGPATSFETSPADFPQNEQASRWRLTMVDVSGSKAWHGR
jgi:hypothetical protein